MREFVRKSKVQRFIAVFMAALLSIGALNSDAYYGLVQNLLGTDASISVEAKALDTGDIVYDYGTMKLNGKHGESYSTTGWTSSTVTSLINGEVTLPGSTTDSAQDYMSCLADFEGTSGNASKEVTDFRAGVADGNEYYYIARGEVTADSGSSGRIAWKVYAWPKNQGWSGTPDVNKDNVSSYWASVTADLTYEKANTVPADESSTKSAFDTEFGRARPRWFSGNVKEAKWFNDQALDEYETAIPSDALENGILTGHSMLWQGQDYSGGRYPWIRVRTDKDLDDHGEIVTRTGINTSDDFLITTYPHRGLGGSGNPKGVYGLSDGSKYYWRAVGVTETDESDLNYSEHSTGSNPAVYSDPYPSGSENGYAQVILKAYDKASFAYSKSPYPTSEGEYPATQDSDQVGVKSCLSQLSEVYENVNQPIEFSSGFYYDGTKPIVGTRMYGFYAVSTDGNNTNNYVFGINALRNKTAEYNQKLGNVGGSWKPLVVNVIPIYDATTEYQRAGGNVTGKYNNDDQIEIKTFASDSETKGHIGYYRGDVDHVICDKVEIKGLDPNARYVILPRIRVNDNGTAIGYQELDDAARLTWVYPASNGTAELVDNPVEIIIPAQILTDKIHFESKIVVWEYLYKVPDDFPVGGTPTLGDIDLANPVASHALINDEDQTVVYIDPTPISDARIDGTTAIDSETGTHEGVAPKQSHIIDMVSMSGLEIGTEYTLVGQIMDITDGSARLEGQANETTFEATDTFETVEVKFDMFNSRGKANRKYVVYEKLYLKSAWDEKGNGATPISTHVDPDDTYQMVRYKALRDVDTAYIESTEALDKNTQSHAGTIDGSGETIIEDHVHLADLTPNINYILKAKVFKVTGSIYTATQIQEVSESFGVNESSGGEADITMEISVPTTEATYGGYSILIYEELYQAEYQDANDMVDAHPANKIVTATGTVRYTPDTSVYEQMVAFPKITTQVNIPKAEPLKGFNVVDEVTLTGLVPEESYRLEGHILDASTGESMINHNSPVSAVDEFVATADTEVRPVVFEDVDFTEYAGSKLVVVQDLFAAGRREKPVATARSLSDPNETIEVIEPTVTTVLTIGEPGEEGRTKIGYATTETTVTDEVKYTGLQQGEDAVYKSVMKLVDDKGNFIKEHGEEVTCVYEFTNTATTYKTLELDITFDATPYENKTITAYNYLYRIIDGEEYLVVSEEKDVSDQKVSFPGDMGMSTRGYVTKTKLHTTVASDSVDLTDIAHIMGLDVGEDYLLVTKIYDKTANDMIEGVEIETKVTAEDMVQDVKVEIEGLDLSSRAGHVLVFYEYLYDSTYDELIAKHTDQDDSLQMITVETPYIDTVATSVASGDKVLPCMEQTMIRDTITYEGLVSGKSYSFVSRVFDKSTGKIPAGFTEVETSFSPTSSKGSVVVTIPINTLSLAGKTLVVGETLMFNSSELAVHEDMLDLDQTLVVEKPTITTKATYGEKNSKVVPCIPIAVILDEITYTDLQPGVNYTIYSTVYDRSTKKIIRYWGEAMDPVTTAFTPETANGKTTVEIPIDTTELGGKNIVVFEEVKVGNVTVCKHDDISDRLQTLTVNKPSITTTATGENNSHDIAFSTKAVINDRVDFKNLETDETYTLHMVVYDKDTGKVLTVTETENNNNNNNNNNDNSNNNNGNNKNKTTKKSAVEATASFTPEYPNGDFTISASFDSTQFVGKTLVVYEELSVGGTIIATHKDLNDENQTVKIAKPGISTVATDMYNKTHTISEPTQDPMIALATQSSKSDGSGSSSSNSSSNQSAGQATINDLVRYSGLKKGESYTLKTSLIDKATGQPVESGKEISTSFEAEGWDGSITIPIPVDVATLAGKTLVVYEELSSGKNVGASHKNINDLNQTVYIGAMATILTSTNENSPKDVGVSAKTQLIDTVAYYGLEPGATYMIVGRIMNKDAVTGAVSSKSKSTADDSAPRAADYKTGNGDNEDTIAIDSEVANDGDASSSSSSSSSSTKSSKGLLVVKSNNSSSGDSSTNLSSETTKASNIEKKPADTHSVTSSDGNSNSSGNSDVERSEALPNKTVAYGTNMKTEVGTFAMYFKPTATSGMLYVPFVVDTRNLQQHDLVAYEVIYKGSTPVISHQNIQDSNQTVTVGTSTISQGKTGVESYAGLLAGIAMGALALAASIVGIFVIRKKRNR